MRRVIEQLLIVAWIALGSGALFFILRFYGIGSNSPDSLLGKTYPMNFHGTTVYVPPTEAMWFYGLLISSAVTGAVAMLLHLIPEIRAKLRGRKSSKTKDSGSD